MTDREMIQDLTNLFRNSAEPFWVRLRQAVHERGVDPATCVLAESFEDDEKFEFGILVTADRRVFQYGFRYCDPSFSDGRLTEWNDVTDRKESMPHSSQAATALLLIDEVT
jgi:hypothetical protein